MFYKNTMLSVLMMGIMTIHITACRNTEDYSQLSDEEKKVKVEEMYQEYAKKMPEVKEIRSETLINGIPEDVILVDVRTAQEQTVSMIPGAITKEVFLQEKEACRDKKIVAYCTVGARSAVFAEKISKDGFQAYNLAGGILAWTGEGGKVVSAAQQAEKKVHTYGKEWDLVPSTHVGVQ